MELPEKIQNVVASLEKIPGVGSKTALRQSLIMAEWEKGDLEEFSHALKMLAELGKCQNCGLYSEKNICHICCDEKRGESGVLCVVESITDCLAIERSEQFQGRYHILGGVLNPLMGVGPEQLGIPRMIERCQDRTMETVILAINSSVEGDATSTYIRQQLPSHLNVERIGFGIPMGGSLEYLDSLTISKALENRRRME